VAASLARSAAPSLGDLDHRCRSWTLQRVGPTIREGVGDFWRCRGVAVSSTAPEAMESWLVVYRTLLAQHLSNVHRLSIPGIAARLSVTRPEAERLLELASTPLLDAMSRVARRGAHERALAIMNTLLPIPMATPTGERLLDAIGGSTPDRMYPEMDLAADVIGSHPDEYRTVLRPVEMKGVLFRNFGRDVTQPLTLADTGSRPLRTQSEAGLVGGIDGTRLPVQRVRYDPNRRIFRPYTSWVYVVVGVAGKPAVIVSLRVGRETSAVVQKVVHDMAEAGVSAPFVVCFDGLATYKSDPFLLSCLTYGFEPHEVNFPWENPAEGAINELKARWPEPCPKEHFGVAVSDAIQEIQDPVRGSTFSRARGRGRFSEATLFLANFRNLRPARVDQGAAYHDGLRIAVNGVADGTPVLTGLRFDQTEDVSLEQCVEAHALAISLDGPSGTPQDWALSMGITGVFSLGSTPLLSKHGRLTPLSEPTHPVLLPLPELAPGTMADRLDLELARADARRPISHAAPLDTKEDFEGSAGVASLDLSGEVSDAAEAASEALAEPKDPPLFLYPGSIPGAVGLPADLDPVETEGSVDAQTEGPANDRRKVHLLRSDATPDDRLLPLLSLAEAVAQAAYVPALPRWSEHPQLRRVATTRGLVSGSRSLGLVLTGHENGTRRSHMILSSATFQQVAYQPLQGSPGRRFDPATSSVVRVLAQSVDGAIRDLRSATSSSSTPEPSSAVRLLGDAQRAANKLRSVHCGQVEFTFDWDGVLDDLLAAIDAVMGNRTAAAIKVLTPLRTRLPRA